MRTRALASAGALLLVVSSQERIELHVEVKGHCRYTAKGGLQRDVFQPERAPQLLAKDISDRDDRRQLHGKHFPDPAEVVEPLSQLKRLLENYDSAAAKFTVEARPSTSTGFRITTGTSVSVVAVGKFGND